MPAAAWDCHAHVFEDRDRYPLSSGRGYEPTAAPLDDYLALLDGHGLAHGVLIQPSVYGFDNQCMLDALDRAGGRLSGVAVPAPDATARELEAMHGRGVRGVRCNLINPGGLQPAVAMRWQPLLRALGWHVELHIAVGDVDDLRPLVRQFDVPVVIDHMGRPRPGHADPSSPRLRQLVELVRNGESLVKLSAPYRLSDGPPPWSDVSPLARTLLDANPTACLWASDWPHVDTPSSVHVDELLAALEIWCPDPGPRRTVLVETPARLYRPD